MITEAMRTIPTKMMVVMLTESIYIYDKAKITVVKIVNYLSIRRLKISFFNDSQNLNIT